MKHLILILITLIGFEANAQFGDNDQKSPAVVEVSTSQQKNGVYYIHLKFNLEPNWIVYDSIIGEGGPIPFSYSIDEIEGLEFVKIIKPKLKKKFDDLMEVEVLYFDQSCTYTLEFKTIGSNPPKYSGTYEFMCCNLVSGICLPPKLENFSN